MTSKEKLLLFVLACLNFTHIMDFMIMMPLGPQLMRYFDISPRQFGLLVSAYSFSAGLSGFFVAFIADRYPRKHIMLIAYTGFVVGTLACAMAPTFGLLIAARTLAGVFGGVLGAQVMSAVSDVFEYQRRASAMGVVMTAFSVASVVGVPLGLYLASEFSWHAPFWFVGILGIVVIGLIWRLIPRLDGHLQDQSKVKHHPFEAITNILQEPNQLRALLLTATIMLGHFSIIPFIAPFFTANAGFSENNLYLIYAVGGALTLFTAPQVGKLADRKGKYPVFVVFALLSMIPMWLITNMNTNYLPIVLGTSGIFFIFSNGRLIPTQAITASVVSSQHRGSFLAINTSLQLLMQSVAVYLAGLVIQKTPDGKLLHYDWVGYAAMGFIFLSIFIARNVKPMDAQVKEVAVE
ncbi:MFS transporter [Runella slithyformis]|uniref:Major facilitator superfamily MFS_1 n=1 Tax=Runella slithyformis (strain ATCC 29530 / DSM 19594 / LMG 11500 / NCIMB 11436 / LSU 4) TaxID=761193 RepID=A0A7U3ZKJ4_RUNSL|nr:MFS transporter [Runella slithyformis]AEI48904.1 major facilitator superfamily MFS_1 [Runella slithyformis DSM 19594]